MALLVRQRAPRPILAASRWRRRADVETLPGGGGSRSLFARLPLLVPAPKYAGAGDDADQDPEIHTPPRSKVGSGQDEAGAENARGGDQPSPQNAAELGIGDHARRRMAP